MYYVYWFPGDRKLYCVRKEYHLHRNSFIDITSHPVTIDDCPELLL